MLKSSTAFENVVFLNSPHFTLYFLSYVYQKEKKATGVKCRAKSKAKKIIENRILL